MMGDLEIVDRGEVPEMAFLPFLEVEQLQMGDHALAVPKQFQHVLGGKFRKLERDAVPAAQAGEPVKQHMGRHSEQFRACPARCPARRERAVRDCVRA